MNHLEIEELIMSVRRDGSVDCESYSRELIRRLGQSLNLYMKEVSKRLDSLEQNVKFHDQQLDPLRQCKLETRELPLKKGDIIRTRQVFDPNVHDILILGQDLRWEIKDLSHVWRFEDGQMKVIYDSIKDLKENL